jgi:hypothetical protein
MRPIFILLCLTTSKTIDIGVTQLKNTANRYLYTIRNFWSGAQVPPIELLGLTSLTAPSTAPTKYHNMLKYFLGPRF